MMKCTWIHKEGCKFDFPPNDHKTENLRRDVANRVWFKYCPECGNEIEVKEEQNYGFIETLEAENRGY